MMLIFYDPKLSMEVTRFDSNMVPLVGDCVILSSSPVYEKVYGYDNKTGFVESRTFDYRTGDITFYLDK